MGKEIDPYSLRALYLHDIHTLKDRMDSERLAGYRTSRFTTDNNPASPFGRCWRCQRPEHRFAARVAVIKENDINLRPTRILIRQDWEKKTLINQKIYWKMGPDIGDVQVPALVVDEWCRKLRLDLTPIIPPDRLVIVILLEAALAQSTATRR